MWWTSVAMAVGFDSKLKLVLLLFTVYLTNY